MIGNKPILVTGPAGNTGRIIVDQFQKRGVTFAAMTHNKQRQKNLKASGIDARFGDFDNPASLDAALKGIGTAYLVCTPDELLFDRETRFIEAAQRAGVDHLVYHSAHLSHTHSSSPNLMRHGKLEEMLHESGLPHTIIRPGGYMQTWALITWALLTGREKFGILSMPGADGKIPLVDVRDVAQATTKVLLEPDQHVGKTYIITGLEAMGYAEHAEIWSKALGKPVEYQSPSERQFQVIMAGLGFTGAPMKHVIQIYRWQRAGELAKVYPGLEEIGVPHTPFEQFVKDWISGETSGGNSFEALNSPRVKMMNELFLTITSARFFLKNIFASAK